MGRRGAPLGLAAHPRVSGENCVVVVCVGLGGGSSPRERGKQIDYGQRALVPRLIPA